MEITYVCCIWLDELEQKVNELLKDGFVPSEHLIIDARGRYIQAMVRL